MLIKGINKAVQVGNRKKKKKEEDEWDSRSGVACARPWDKKILTTELEARRNRKIIRKLSVAVKHREMFLLH